MKSFWKRIGVASLACAALLAAAPRAAADEQMDYDITWVGVSVGTMVVRSGTNAAGHLVRSLRIWNRPWIALVYPVDTTVECEIESTPQGPHHVVRKRVLENDFRQDDVLELWPDQGEAYWSNAVQHVAYRSVVPVGSRDLASFFFDLRDAISGSPLQVGGDYQLVMDGAIHDLKIEIGAPKTLRTPFGKQAAIPVSAESKSPTLFSRNRPKSVWVATTKPAVLFADVESRFGPVRATLVKWTMDGAPVALAPAPAKP
ncbi:MAG TPA: DUF3108 domain-containing protein [Kiritimatiellia bacterium]|nr:DUF3108 domain-containing protein [Kiritimatiellia bacterium]